MVTEQHNKEHHADAPHVHGRVRHDCLVWKQLGRHVLESACIGFVLELTGAESGDAEIDYFAGFFSIVSKKNIFKFKISMYDVSIMALLNAKSNLPEPLFNIFFAHTAHLSKVPL